MSQGRNCSKIIIFKIIFNNRFNTIIRHLRHIIEILFLEGDTLQVNCIFVQTFLQSLKDILHNMM